MALEKISLYVYSGTYARSFLNLVWYTGCVASVLWQSCLGSHADIEKLNTISLPHQKLFPAEGFLMLIVIFANALLFLFSFFRSFFLYRNRKQAGQSEPTKGQRVDRGPNTQCSGRPNKYTKFERNWPCGGHRERPRQSARKSPQKGWRSLNTHNTLSYC